jgi:hypothetical protein
VGADNSKQGEKPVVFNVDTLVMSNQSCPTYEEGRIFELSVRSFIAFAKLVYLQQRFTKQRETTKLMRIARL